MWSPATAGEWVDGCKSPNKELTSVCRVNQQSGECLGKVSSFRSRCYRNHIQPKSEQRVRQIHPFIEWCHMHAWRAPGILVPVRN